MIVGTGWLIHCRNEDHMDIFKNNIKDMLKKNEVVI